MAIIPEQIRSVDPYSENRYSSSVNRLTRIVTGGNDVVLDPAGTFIMQLVDTTSISVGPGICIKDDVLIHITEDPTIIDLSMSGDADTYIDSVPYMDSTGYYYLVLKYQYNRSLPAPKAEYRIIKDKNLYTMYADSLIFLGTIKVSYSGESLSYYVEAVYDYDPSVDPPLERSSSVFSPSEIDGGSISVGVL